MSAPLLEVEGLEVSYERMAGLFARRSSVRVVDGVSFTLGAGETLGIVGESGSGKTTVARAILRAINPSGGSIRLNVDGEAHELVDLPQQRLRPLRRHMQMVFQDPYSSLNPRMTVRDIIAEPLVCMGGKGLTRDDIDGQVREIAAKCRLNLEHLRRFPHTFSGGQRQRICIARSLLVNPRLIVCDESVAALDVSTQADIINLLRDLQEEFGVSYIFISHDMNIVANVASRVAVMYAGTIVEQAPTERIFTDPRHPYTRALISAIPHLGRGRGFQPIRLAGEPPASDDLPSGCRFRERCSYAREECAARIPELRELAAGRRAACHFAEDLGEAVQAPARAA